MDKPHSNTLIARREERGLTRKALAEALGVTERTVRRWEDGERMPRPGDIKSLEALIGITATEVVENHLRASAESTPANEPMRPA